MALGLIEKYQLTDTVVGMHLRGHSLREITSVANDLLPDDKSVSVASVHRFIRRHRDAIETAREDRVEKVVEAFVTEELPGALDILRRQLAEMLEIRDRMLKILTRQVKGDLSLGFSPTIELFIRIDAVVHEKVMCVIRLGGGDDDSRGRHGAHPVDLEQFKRDLLKEREEVAHG